MADEVQVGAELATVLAAGNIDMDGLVVPGVAKIDLIEDDTEAALIVDRAFRALHMAIGRAWVVEAGYADVINRRSLWQKLVNPDTGAAYGSFKDWVENATAKGRTTVYGEMTLLRELPMIPADEMADINKANLFTLLKVKRRAGASKVTPDLIHRSKYMKDADFAKYCQALMPGAAADELQNTIKFQVPESIAVLFGETVDMYKVLLSTNDWERIVEQMCVDARVASFGNPSGLLTSLEGQENWEAFVTIQQTMAAAGKPLNLQGSGRKMKGVAVVSGPAQPQVPDAFDANTQAMVDGDGLVADDDMTDDMTEEIEGVKSYPETPATLGNMNDVLACLSMDDDEEPDPAPGPATPKTPQAAIERLSKMHCMISSMYGNCSLPPGHSGKHEAHVEHSLSNPAYYKWGICACGDHFTGDGEMCSVCESAEENYEEAFPF